MKRSAFYIFIVLGLLSGVRELIYAGLRKNKSGEFDKLTTIFIKPNSYNTLFIGSSRAESHFVPSIIDSITGLTSFNAGQAGAGLEQSMAVLKSYLVHSVPPCIVVLNIDIQKAASVHDSVYDFPKYFAYLFFNKKLDEYLEFADSRFRCFKWLPFCSMPYMNDYYLSASLRGWSGKPNEQDKMYIKGFSPEYMKTEVNLEKAYYAAANYELSDSFVKNLRELMLLCRNNHIQLILATTPLYHKAIENAKGMQLMKDLKKIAQDNKLPFIDDLDCECCRDKRYFANPGHLNKEGAFLFSEKFAFQLRQYLP